jgi:hypothetical protein
VPGPRPAAAPRERLAEGEVASQVGEGGAFPGPVEVDVAAKKRREPVRLVEPESLLGHHLDLMTAAVPAVWWQGLVRVQSE